MRILVCGDRNFTDIEKMKSVLYEMFDIDDTVTLIHGDARGADKLSEEVLCKYLRSCTVEKYPANWEKYGKAAGPIRNKQMLVEGKPDLVIAFLAPNSKGTANMIKQAKEAQVPVEVVNI